MFLNKKITASPDSVKKFGLLLDLNRSRIDRIKKNFTELSRLYNERFFYLKPYLIPTRPNYKKHIFTEGINYFRKPNTSIWGKGDKDTLKYLKEIKLSGNWLNLSAGDGRYNNLLLKKVKGIVANDIDKSALSKLWSLTPKRYRRKLNIEVFDINKRFPYPSNYFDGLFCTGILHLFSKKDLKKHLFPEMKRVIKKKGRIIFDFATEIKRISPTKKIILYAGEPQYKSRRVLEFLGSNCGKTIVKIIESNVNEDLTKIPGAGYHFSCKFFLIDFINN